MLNMVTIRIVDPPIRECLYEVQFICQNCGFKTPSVFIRQKDWEGYFKPGLARGAVAFWCPKCESRQTVSYKEVNYTGQH